MSRRTEASRSLVAGVNALFRATETARPPGRRLLEDPWAARLAERDARVMAVRYGRFLLPALGAMVDELQAAHCVRHRSIDELVLQAIRARGCRQVVLVGAGYDMRASRFASEGVRWIEIDRAETIARKRRLLAGARGVNPHVESVALDLLTGSLASALASARFDANAPACFVLEGVIHYLTTSALDAVLGAVRAVSPGATVVLSFIRSDVYVRATPMFIRLVQLMREIPRLHFTREGLAALAAGHGLPRVETWTIEQQIETFAPEGRGRSVSLSQDVALLEGQVL